MVDTPMKVSSTLLMYRKYESWWFWLVVNTLIPSVSHGIEDRLLRQPRRELPPAGLARDWNVKDSGAGFVTRFAVLAADMSNFAVQKVGAAEHTEYWIPAEELATFNENIVGLIEVIQEFGGGPHAK